MSDLVERLRRGIHHPGYVIGQHWMSVAYDRICAGESQDSVMSDYGFVRSAEIEQLRAERDQWKSGSAIVNDKLLTEIERLQARCAELETALLHESTVKGRVAELEKDAARYRWLRGDAPPHSERWSRWDIQRWEGGFFNPLERETLDAAIDAAIEGKL